MTRLDFEPILLILSLTVSGLAAPQQAAGPDPEVGAFLAHWAKSMQNVRTLRVEFRQQKQLKILRRPLVSQGRTLMAGETVLMVVDGKDGRPETEVLVRPGEARIHYPRLRRLEVLPLGEGAPPPTPFPLFGADLEELPETYRLSLEEDEEGEVLVLIPRGPSPIKETRMRFDDRARVREVVQKTARGETLTLTVTTFEVNPDLSDEALALDVPEGTEVVKLGKGGR